MDGTVIIQISHQSVNKNRIMKLIDFQPG